MLSFFLTQWLPSLSSCQVLTILFFFQQGYDVLKRHLHCHICMQCIFAPTYILSKRFTFHVGFTEHTQLFKWSLMSLLTAPVWITQSPITRLRRFIRWPVMSPPEQRQGVNQLLCTLSRRSASLPDQPLSTNICSRLSYRVAARHSLIQVQYVTDPKTLRLTTLGEEKFSASACVCVCIREWAHHACPSDLSIENKCCLICYGLIWGNLVPCLWL